MVSITIVISDGGNEIFSTGKNEHILDFMMYWEDVASVDRRFDGLPVVVQRNGSCHHLFNLVVGPVVGIEEGWAHRRYGEVHALKKAFPNHWFVSQKVECLVHLEKDQ